MSEHTKGPSWSRLSRYAREGWLVVQSNIFENDCRTDGRLDVFECERVYVPNAVAAAAPELLEALEHIAERADAQEEAGHHTIELNPGDVMIVRDTLAKARGKNV